MFVLLEHDRTHAAVSPAERGVHWDLLIEVPDQERLPTWQLATNPLTTTDPIMARRIQDHRPLYLDYEGPLSDDRGTVRRLDRGPAKVQPWDADRMVVTLEGTQLRGQFAITPDADGVTRFRPQDDPPDARV